MANHALPAHPAAHQDRTANPAPLGLLGFGMTTILLNLHNAGLFELGAMVLAMGIFYGGMAQVCAGLMEWVKGNTFGTVAFTSYGFFWLTLAALIMLPATGLAAANSAGAMTAFLAMWGLLTAVLFVGTLKLNRATQIVFASLTVLFFMLALADATGNHALKVLAGWEGLFCGFAAVYVAAAQILNEMYGRVILPLGEQVRSAPAAVLTRKAA
ncbi:acetate uptake transporter [Uliginosibacterium sp. H1]|uniref:acetate uptake transporter n=1 Tax=Uliginosibacterium sp. H1 TaxID=3114757 RepID=UPI002E1807FB|nr:acetate uptake transporter [Uliginosibacterium sp. H1]